MKNSLVRAGVSATVLATVVGLAGCGSRGTEAGSSASGGDTAKKKAVIGLITPLSGGLSAMGLGMKNSVDLAVKQANESNAIPGWTLALDAKDDEGKPEPGKNAATQHASNDDVVGVVGTLNSSVAAPVQPVLNTANIVMVSPANTNPTLTKGADPANPQRLYANYFRTCTTDAVQGPFAAQYLVEQGIKKVATIHDKKTYGQGLVEAFTKEFQAKGGSIATVADHQPRRRELRRCGPAGQGCRRGRRVYYGGEYPQAGPLSQQLHAAGTRRPGHGWRRRLRPAVHQARRVPSPNGDLATSVGAPIAKAPKGQEFLDAYTKAGYKEAAVGVRRVRL